MSPRKSGRTKAKSLRGRPTNNGSDSAYRYFAVYKPFGFLSRFGKDAPDQKVLKDLFPELPTDVYPVGRLDKDSEGLLLLTNDPSANHRILSSDQKWQKRYWVQVEGQPDDKALEPLRQGVAIRINGEVYKTRPAFIRILDKSPDMPPREPPIRVRKEIPTTWVEISLVEGKNRQVRKMMAAIGFPVLRLTRMSIGPINLEGLLPAEILELKKPFWLI